MTEASQESMDSKLLHVGNYSQQIASHRQTHTYRAVPLNILREGGLSFRVTTPSGIPVVALKKIIKKYPPTTGKKFSCSLSELSMEHPQSWQVASLSHPTGILTVFSLLVPGVSVSSRNNVPLG